MGARPFSYCKKRFFNRCPRGEAFLWHALEDGFLYCSPIIPPSTVVTHTAWLVHSLQSRGWWWCFIDSDSSVNCNTLLRYSSSSGMYSIRALVIQTCVMSFVRVFNRTVVILTRPKFAQELFAGLNFRIYKSYELVHISA